MDFNDDGAVGSPVESPSRTLSEPGGIGPHKWCMSPERPHTT